MLGNPPQLTQRPHRPRLLSAVTTTKVTPKNHGAPTQEPIPMVTDFSSMEALTKHRGW